MNTILKSFKENMAAIDVTLVSLKEKDLALSTTDCLFIDDVLQIFEAFATAKTSLEGKLYGTLYRVVDFYSDIKLVLKSSHNLSLGFSCDMMPILL